MQKTFLLSLLAFMPCLLFAQKQYLDATITTNDGKKLIGKILAENWVNTPTTLDFSATGTASKTYRVKELSAFEVIRNDGSRLYFDRKAVEVETSTTQLGELDFEPALRYQKDTVWLQLLFHGTEKLYYYRALTGKVHYLVESSGQQPVELVIKLWRRQESDKYRINSVDLYRKQLSDLAKDCPAAAKLALSSNWGPKSGELLKEKDLLLFFKTLNACQGTTIKYIIAPEKSKMTGQLLAGGHIANFAFNQAANRSIKGIGGIQLGFGVNFFLKKSNKRAAIYNEVLLGKDFNKTYKNITYGTQNFVYLNEYQSTQALVSNMFTIRVTKSAIAPTLKIGIAHRLGIDWEITERAGLENQIDDLPAIDKHYYKQFYEFGPTLGLGVQYKRIGLDLRMVNTYKTGYFGLSNAPSSKYFMLNLIYRVF